MKQFNKRIPMKTKLFLFTCISTCFSIFSSGDDAAAPPQTMIERLQALVQAHPQDQRAGDITSFKTPDAINPRTRRRDKLLAIVAYSALDQVLQDQDGTEEAATTDEMFRMLEEHHRRGTVNADNRTISNSRQRPVHLHQAARCAHSTLIQAFLLLGADRTVDNIDDSGLTPLGHLSLKALDSRHTEDMIKAAGYCLQAGGNPHIPDARGITAASNFYTKLQQLTAGQHEDPSLVGALQGVIRQFPAQLIAQPQEHAPSGFQFALRFVGDVVVAVGDKWVKTRKTVPGQRAVAVHHQVEDDGTIRVQKQQEEPVEITEVGSPKGRSKGTDQQAIVDDM